MFASPSLHTDTRIGACLLQEHCTPPFGGLPNGCVGAGKNGWNKTQATVVCKLEKLLLRM